MTLTGESQVGVIVQATTTADALVNGPSSSNVFSVGYNDSTGTAGKDILIQQMTIQNGAYGIRSKAGDTSVIDTTVQHNGWNGQGLPADKAAAAALWASSATNSGGGIRIRNASDITVANNTVSENLRGLRVQDSDNVSVYGNTAEQNLESGLYFSSSTYNGNAGVTNSVMHDNISRGNLNNGILSIGGLGNDIYNNTVEDNYNSGVMLWAPSQITVRQNTISNNNLESFNGIGNDGDAYSGVTIAGDVTTGTETFTAKILDNVIDDNKAGRQASAVAISVEGTSPSAGITIQGNTISNYDIGLRVEDGVVTITGNTFDGTTGNATDVLIGAAAGTVTIGANNTFGGDTYFINNQSSQSLDLTSNGTTFDETDNFRIEDKLFHGPDSATSGVIRVVAGNLHVSAPGTGANDETIQNAIDAATAGDTVTVEGGAFTEDVDVNKAITLTGLATIDGLLTVSDPGATIDPGFSPGVIASGNLSLGAGTTSWT
jgi:parallel beta-helix repeat protein